eukprot:gnl/Spiro4/1335_TR710_c0_g1_i1.p1 gnl/Spiro4/1335_TR710_c0_g1~~gnl/Spiro4/1335_TR710_c0_g1_i1.p1  ORF type:complete len:120 (-),score=18.15 gnl/Spiro4/1335_TR710_c0_g1_i1:98-409(-)
MDNVRPAPIQYSPATVVWAGWICPNVIPNPGNQTVFGDRSYDSRTSSAHTSSTTHALSVCGYQNLAKNAYCKRCHYPRYPELRELQERRSSSISSGGAGTLSR